MLLSIVIFDMFMLHASESKLTGTKKKAEVFLKMIIFQYSFQHPVLVSLLNPLRRVPCSLKLLPNEKGLDFTLSQCILYNLAHAEEVRNH